MIGARIKERRQKLRYTQKMLADKVSVSPQVISNWERGYTEPSADDISRLSQALECSSGYLLGESDKSNQPNTSNKTSTKEERDIAKKLESILGDLDNTNSLAFNGEPMDDHTRELVRAQIESNLRVAKEMARKKFTPKKYQTDNND